jgi:undecaprenyl phosphate-alpha-L-ara4N flippase subunit ArnE
MLRAASILVHSVPQPGWRDWLNGTAIVAVLIYGSAMLLWLWLLGRVPLTQAFAFFGLSFFIVPFLANRFLGDAVSVYTWLGAAVISVGVVVTNWRPA